MGHKKSMERKMKNREVTKILNFCALKDTITKMKR